MPKARLSVPNRGWRQEKLAGSQEEIDTFELLSVSKGRGITRSTRHQAVRWSSLPITKEHSFRLKLSVNRAQKHMWSHKQALIKTHYHEKLEEIVQMSEIQLRLNFLTDADEPCFSWTNRQNWLVAVLERSIERKNTDTGKIVCASLPWIQTCTPSNNHKQYYRSRQSFPNLVSCDSGHISHHISYELWLRSYLVTQWNINTRDTLKKLIIISVRNKIRQAFLPYYRIKKRLGKNLSHPFNRN